VEINIINRCCN